MATQNDSDFLMTYPCYFLCGEGGGLQCNTVDGKDCLCLFTNLEVLQQFWTTMHQQVHGPAAANLTVAFDTCDDRDGLLNRMKSGEKELAKAGFRHIVINPRQGWPAQYVTIRDFIEYLETT